MTNESISRTFERWRMESGAFWSLCSGLKSFYDSETGLRASALTYYTILAIIPIFAVIFGISSGFGILNDVDAMARERFSDHQQVYEFAKSSAEHFVRNASGGLITSVAILFLLWTVVNILSQVEAEFNRIWRCRRQRSLVRRITDYTALIILLPLLTVIGNGATMWMLARTGSTATHFALKILPTIATCFVAFSSYYLLPSQRIRPSSALIAAVVSGISYQTVQYIFIRFQVGVTTYSTLYGSFAAVPLFLVWAQVSWTIILAGAELGYAWQYRSERFAIMRVQRLRRRERSAWAVTMASQSVQAFAATQACPTKRDFTKLTNLPETFIDAILDDLLRAQILVKSYSGPNTPARYSPARPIDQLRVSDALAAVMGTLEEGDVDDASKQARDAISSLWEGLTQADANVLLSKLSSKAAP